MDFQYFIELFFGGLTRGSIYALIALGYTLVYGIIELINFAHGEIYMLGAFTALLVAGVLGIVGFPAGGILIVAALAAVVWSAAYGYTLEKVAYKPLRGAPRLSPLISAIGMSIFLQNYVLLAQTSDYVPFPPPAAGYGISGLPGQHHGAQRLPDPRHQHAGHGLLKPLHPLHPHGQGHGATAQNRKMALLLASTPTASSRSPSSSASALAALGGVLIASHMGQVNFGIGFLAGLKAFTAAVLGGIGSIPGAMVGGLVLGIAESMTTGYLSGNYEDALAFALLILILIFRPDGILGKAKVQKV